MAPLLQVLSKWPLNNQRDIKLYTLPEHQGGSMIKHRRDSDGYILTLWVDALVKDELAVSEKVEQRLKVVWTAVNEKSTSRVCCT